MTDFVYKSPRTVQLERELEESRMNDKLILWAEEEILNYTDLEMEALYTVIHNHLHGED